MTGYQEVMEFIIGWVKKDRMNRHVGVRAGRTGLILCFWLSSKGHSTCRDVVISWREMDQNWIPGWLPEFIEQRIRSLQ